MSGTRPDSRLVPATRPGALLIAAHGDCGGGGGNVLASELARRVRHLHLYDEVTVGFMRCGPSIEDAASHIATERLRIYPLFMSDGYYVRDAIPHRLGIVHGLDSFGHRVDVDRPLGLDPHLPTLLGAAASQAADAAGINAAEAGLLLVAHGSAASPHSADAARSIAARMSEESSFRSVETAFLEEEPFFLERVALVRRPVIVMGLFAGGGMHADEDVRGMIAELGDPGVHFVAQLGGYARIIEMIAAGLSMPAAEVQP